MVDEIDKTVLLVCFDKVRLSMNVMEVYYIFKVYLKIHIKLFQLNESAVKSILKLLIKNRFNLCLID